MDKIAELIIEIIIVTYLFNTTFLILTIKLISNSWLIKYLMKKNNDEVQKVQWNV
jgi:hypothetical protein